MCVRSVDGSERVLDQGNEYWKGTPVRMDSSVERASSPFRLDRTAKMAVPPGDGNSSDSASLHYDAAAMTRRLDSRRSLWFGCNSALAFGSRLNGSSPFHRDHWSRLYTSCFGASNRGPELGTQTRNQYYLLRCDCVAIGACSVHRTPSDPPQTRPLHQVRVRFARNFRGKFRGRECVSGVWMGASECLTKAMNTGRELRFEWILRWNGLPARSG